MKIKKIISVLFTIIFFTAGFYGIAFCRAQLWPTVKSNFFVADKLPGFTPKSENIKPAIFGYDNFVADIYWLKAIQFVGANAAKEEFKSLYEMLDLVTDLDPNFQYPYHFGGILLPLSGEPDNAVALLEKGRENIPSSWQILWDMAFVKYFYLDEYEEAANIYDECLKLPGCLGGAKNIAANLRAKTGKYEIALQEWKRIYEDPNSTKGEKELAVLKIEENQKLVDLNILAKEFEKSFKQKIKSLDDLKRTYPKIPADAYVSPFRANPFVWNAEKGMVRTMNW